MRPSALSLLLSTSIVVALLAGCEGSVEGSDGGRRDGGAAADAGARPDGGAAGDSGGAERDSGARTDGGALADGGALDDAGADAGPLEYLTPDDPGTGDVRLDVHTGQGRHPISPWIYGHNSPRFEAGVTMIRLGGNRWSAYNWENNYSNAGSDWCHQNDGFLSPSDTTPGEAIRPRVQAGRDAGAAALVTIPMLGYVSADGDGGSDPPGCSGDVANSGSDYLSTRFVESRPRKGSAFTYPPDTADGLVSQDELVAWLEDTFDRDSGPPLFYSLDNEPDLWSHTHARLHPEPARYAEIRDLTVEYASAIKDVAPEALTFGPVNYGWQGYRRLQDAPDADGRDFLEYFLAQMAAAEASEGRRLLDVLDLHWYPEARGGGMRITVDDASSEVAAARVQAPRSLWDPTYVEDSWILDTTGGAPIRLLPRVQEKIDASYPGTRLAITEYYYGGGADISGGVAQADVLGIFADHDVFAASLWHLGSTDDRFILAAFRMYRDVDGSGAGFGDVSVRSGTDDPERSSVHASVSGDRVVLVMINRSAAPLDAAVAVTHHARLRSGHAWTLTDAAAEPVDAGGFPIEGVNAFVRTLPAMSVSTVILEP